MSKETFKFGRGQVYFAKAKPQSWIDRLLRRPRQYEPYKPFGHVSDIDMTISVEPKPPVSIPEKLKDAIRAWWAR